MTKDVTDPLEKQFRNLEHVDTITSSTYEGLSRIDIAYTSKANMKDAAREVEKAVNTIKLPKDVTKPVVSQLNTSMIPLAQITIQKQNGFQKQMKNKLKKKSYHNSKTLMVLPTLCFSENPPLNYLSYLIRTN